MLNKEMVQFFESILEERSDEFRVTESDLVSPSAFEKKAGQDSPKGRRTPASARSGSAFWDAAPG